MSLVHSLKNFFVSGKFGNVVNRIEEFSIATCLGLMTLITFSNVVARYIFNSNILWAMELSLFLFAWLVLMGASYAVKTHIHIGVDAVVNRLSPTKKKFVTMLALLACLAFSIMLLIGAWQYWLPFAGERAWLETDDIPMPAILNFMSCWLNECEPYEKLPRMIPYFALPLGTLLLTIRFIQVGWKLLHGDVELLISSHDVEVVRIEAEKPTANSGSPS